MTLPLEVNDEQVSLLESQGWQEGIRILDLLSYGLACLALLFRSLELDYWHEMVIISLCTLFVIKVTESYAAFTVQVSDRLTESWLGRLARSSIFISGAWIVLSALFFILKYPGREFVSDIALSLSLFAVALWISYSWEARSMFWLSKKEFMQQVLKPILLFTYIWTIGNPSDLYQVVRLLEHYLAN